MDSMTDMRILIEQIVADITNDASKLGKVRLWLFLKWLKAHSNKVKEAAQAHIEEAIPDQGCIDERLKNGLKLWFESLPIPWLLWEYRLILDEINWWRVLEDRALLRMLIRAGKK
ncbi:MAG: hypothetical protein HY863_02150 [Chloroflexi bacterium]|nr:hypothetical protein [Chloroflexota bacterium]